MFNNYRNKVTFHIFNSKLGFYNSNSNDLVEIDNCLLLDKDINNLIPKIKELDLTNINILTVVRTLIIVFLIVVYLNNSIPKKNQLISINADRR